MTGPEAAPQDQEREALDAFHAGRWPEAAVGFSRLRELYERRGDPVKAAEMANNICVALLQTGNAQQALEAVRGTPEILASLSSELLSAKAYGNLASALDASGELDEAEAAYRKAVEILGRLGETESQSQTLRALSQLQFRRGRTLDAVLTMQSALESGARQGLRDRFLRWLVRLPLRIQGR